MEDNLTLEEEEIVHENSYIEFLPNHPILRRILEVVGVIVLLSLPAIGHIT